MIIELPYRGQSVPAAKPSVAVRGRARLLTLASLGYLLVVLAMWMVLREAGDRWWPATALLLLPRWPLAVPLLGLWPWAVWARRWAPIGVIGPATLIAIGPVMGLRVSSASLGSARAEVRVLTCNIHRQHVDTDALAEYIAAVRPDVVALQGWSRSGHGTLFAADSTGSWDVRREGELLVASRSPIASVTALRFPDQGGAAQGERGAAAVFELQTRYGIVHLVNLHLASPHAGLAAIISDGGGKLSANIERRRLESETVRTAAEGLRGNVILAGDFNTTDDSPIFRENWAYYADAFSTKGSGFGLTYCVRSTQIRIDHILAAPPMQTVRCWVGPDVGSPHRPFVADLNCR